MTNSEALREMFKRKGKSYEDIALEMGYANKSSIVHILRNPKKNLTVEKAAILANILGVKPIKVIRVILN